MRYAAAGGRCRLLLGSRSGGDRVCAHKDPTTPEQLQAFQDAFVEEVIIGDLLFHGDAATEKKARGEPVEDRDGLRHVPPVRL